MDNVSIGSVLALLVLLFGGGMVIFRGKISANGKVRSALNVLFNSFSKKKLDSVEHEQVKVQAKIDANKKLDADIQKKIRDEIDNSAKKIQDILDSKPTVKNVDSTADEGWEKL